MNLEHPIFTTILRLDIISSGDQMMNRTLGVAHLQMATKDFDEHTTGH